MLLTWSLLTAGLAGSLSMSLTSTQPDAVTARTSLKTNKSENYQSKKKMPRVESIFSKAGPKVF